MTLEHARALRHRQTDAEKKLWQHLRDRRFSGLKFRRQLRIEPYIVDFVCDEPKIVIELDGSQHAQQQDYDATRTKFLERLGYRVLRFWDNDVLKNIDAVLEELLLTVTHPSPQPSPGGRGSEETSSNPFPPLPPGEGWGEGVNTPKPPTLLVRHLGLRDYAETWRAMQQFTAQRDATTPDEIWLLEHPPVFTQGLNGKREHLLAPGDIPLVQTDRGGQVTYHGPGQLVVYVLLDLQRRGWGVRQLVEALELSVIDLLRDYGITATARRDAPGVYVNGAKIASLGLRVKRGRSYHGLSLNVAMDLEPFSRINPCGYAGLPVTQLSALGANHNLEKVADDLLRHLGARLGYNSATSIL